MHYIRGKIFTFPMEHSENEKYRNWEVTINNPEAEDFDLIKKEDTRYTKYVRARGTMEKTEHVHVLFCYTNRHNFSTLKKRYPRAHINFVRHMEAYKGYLADEHEEVLEVYESGTAPLTSEQKGKRSAEIYSKCIKYARSGDLESIVEQHPALYVAHLQKWKTIKMDNPVHYPPLSELDNVWVWGATGTGKSRGYREATGEDVYYPKSHDHWWNGYKGEANVIIEDLAKIEGKRHWITDLLKLWSDHYEFIADSKYGSQMIRPKRIVVTSNYNMDEVFYGEDLKALKRRFRIIHHNKIC